MMFDKTNEIIKTFLSQCQPFWHIQPKRLILLLSNIFKQIYFVAIFLLFPLSFAFTVAHSLYLSFYM